MDFPFSKLVEDRDSEDEDLDSQADFEYDA